MLGVGCWVGEGLTFNSCHRARSTAYPPTAEGSWLFHYLIGALVAIILIMLSSNHWIINLKLEQEQEQITNNTSNFVSPPCWQGGGQGVGKKKWHMEKGIRNKEQRKRDNHFREFS